MGNNTCYFKTHSMCKLIIEVIANRLQRISNVFTLPQKNPLGPWQVFTIEL